MGWAAENRPKDKDALKPFKVVSDQPVQTQLIAEHTSIQPGGRTRIGILFTIEEGWHIYAKIPGDAGLPTKTAWSSPVHVLFEPLEWPKPQEFMDPGDVQTFGYAGVVLLGSALTAPKDVQGTIPIHAEAEWLSCKNICVPGSSVLDLSLPIGDQPPAPSSYASFFMQHLPSEAHAHDSGAPTKGRSPDIDDNLSKGNKPLESKTPVKDSASKSTTRPVAQ